MLEQLKVLEAKVRERIPEADWVSVGGALARYAPGGRDVETYTLKVWLPGCGCLHQTTEVGASFDVTLDKLVAKVTLKKTNLCPTCGGSRTMPTEG